MKKLLFVLMAVALCVVSTSAIAADLTLSWNAVPGADGYRIYHSTSFEVLPSGEISNVVWDVGVDVGDVTSYVYSNPPEGLTLWKASAYVMTIVNEEHINNSSGAWSNPAWSNEGGPSVGVE